MEETKDRELLRLMALKTRWPRGGGPEEFGNEKQLDRAIDRLADQLWGSQLKVTPVEHPAERGGIVDVSVATRSSSLSKKPLTVRCDGCGIETGAFTSSAPTADKFCTECVSAGRAEWSKAQRLEYIDIQDLARMAEALKPDLMQEVNLEDVSEHLGRIAVKMNELFVDRMVDQDRLRTVLKEAGGMLDKI